MAPATVDAKQPILDDVLRHIMTDTLGELRARPGLAVHEGGAGNEGEGTGCIDIDVRFARVSS